ncbi:MAG TPA: fatty acid desaturase [Rhodoblastus sp.]|nr:fatty acid desaturase [Rhodoblastus sp.]
MGTTSCSGDGPRRATTSSRLIAVLPHLRFGLQDATNLFVLSSLLAGGARIWIAFVILIATIYGANKLLPDDLTEPENPPHALHDFFARLALPLILANALLLMHYFADGDPLGLVAGLKALGVDFAAARARSSAFDKTFAIILMAIMFGIGQATAHELSHRLHSRFDLALSQWISALALDPASCLHHPYSHHRLVGLPNDPGTARRGEDLYRFTVRSFIGSHAYAINAEAARLKRQNRRWLSFENRFIRAWSIVFLYVGVAFFIGGIASALAFVATLCLAHLMLEGITYVQHYGLIRLEGERINERISWDVHGAIAAAMNYNVGRHSDHHLHPLRHGADLKITKGAPSLPYNYTSLVGIALIPPLYRRFMQPYLDHWDRHFATPAERAYMRDHNIPHAEPEPVQTGLAA